jgi:hypothetical protein
MAVDWKWVLSYIDHKALYAATHQTGCTQRFQEIDSMLEEGVIRPSHILAAAKSILGPEAQAAAKVVDTGSDPMPVPQCSTQQPIRDSEPMDSDDAPGPAKVLKAGPESMDLTGMTRKRKRHLLYTA